MEKKDMRISTKVLQIISAEQAYAYRIIPVDSGDKLVFLTDSLSKKELEKELEIVLGKEIFLKGEESRCIDNYLHRYYRKREIKNASLYYSDDFLLNIIHEAKELGSSDIHFETFEKRNRVRFRIDGKLLERYIILNEEYPKIVNRIKIMGGLDISEKRLPQDGRITIKSSHEDFDIRVSSLPILHGEKLVLRILSKNTLTTQLNDLGFSKKELKIYESAIRKPNGIVLISGPTGSGKTTTLYATLKLLNKDDTNILTIEDPVEYTLEGISQVQLKENIGLDFASTLRAFLRQDPDIIMVGEIRDIATANMVIRAALTGHLVLSTIHTNSAWATISRLIDMGVPSFLIASTLNVSVAQRLVRKLCVFCKEKAYVSLENASEILKISENITSHYKAVGCPNCHQTGYKGRKAVYEIIEVTKELIENIQEKKLDISDYLKEKEIRTLKDNALRLVLEGVTSIDEVYPLLIDE
ncbi:general secretory pathway component, cryptic [Tenacibaculum maritimum]|uniref:GspE/PulE family protein n=1 Tax=Tenacibaculum maritimum TaxID=107401 RepID=UPI0012E4DDAC|nr:GspE/PulE family protein [Tenacibaculum maritimum]CAA0249126.1 general secretory pathway component, cryptic [Tenacibaculum maritimum]